MVTAHRVWAMRQAFARHGLFHYSVTRTPHRDDNNGAIVWKHHVFRGGIANMSRGGIANMFRGGIANMSRGGIANMSRGVVI